MIQFIFSLVLISIILISLLWLVGIVQQKEYRLDRLQSYFSSMGWRVALLAIFPFIEALRFRRIRRPRLTSRAIFVLSLSFVSALVSFLLIFLWAYSNPYLQNMRFYTTTISLIFTLPLLVILWSFTTAVGVWIVTTWNLYLLKEMIIKYDPKVIGITGSYGKTTTKQLLVHVLSSTSRVFTTPGSVNTPLAIARHFLNNYRGEEVVVVEYAAYCVGEISRLARVITPTMVVLTGFTDQHIALFGTRLNIALAKAELVDALLPEGSVYCSEPGTMEIVDSANTSKPIRLHKVWEDSNCVFELSPSGRLGISLGSNTIQTDIIGLQNTSSVRSAVLVAREFAVPEEQIARSLKIFKPTKNWIERRQLLSGAVLIDDGLSTNPKGFSAAISLVEKLDPKQAILVTAGIVDLGERSRELHSELARQASKVFNEVWYLGSEGRNQFGEILGEKLISDQVRIRTKLTKISQDTLILIEGKLPTWFEKELES